MADAGYEVWLGNNRGNTYSNTNEYYSYDDDDFWNFSWDEMANVDLPTMIDYVLAETGEEQLYYVGHSEGTTQAFAGFQNATLASKIKLFVALAPVAYADHCASKFLVTLAAFRIDDLLVILGFDHFLVQSDWMDAFLDGESSPLRPLVLPLGHCNCPTAILFHSKQKATAVARRSSCACMLIAFTCSGDATVSRACDVAMM